MKLCILCRDGHNVYEGMVWVVSDVIREFFGDVNVRNQKDIETEYTEMMTFIVPEEKEDNIVPFIREVCRLNTVYAVRIIKNNWNPRK